MELYADEWLKVPALHYRWFYDDEFAHMMMDYNNDPQASPAEQRRVGTKIASMFRGWPEHLGATHETRAAVEASFTEYLALMDKHFAIHPYFLGGDPSIADWAMMGPLYAHLCRDPYSGAIVHRDAPAVCAWIERMHAPEASLGADPTAPDIVPPKALELLRHLGSD
jgi:glutathione S-transferase